MDSSSADGNLSEDSLSSVDFELWTSATTKDGKAEKNCAVGFRLVLVCCDGGRLGRRFLDLFLGGPEVASEDCSDWGVYGACVWCCGVGLEVDCFGTSGC